MHTQRAGNEFCQAVVNVVSRLSHKSKIMFESSVVDFLQVHTPFQKFLKHIAVLRNCLRKNLTLTHGLGE